MTSLGDLYRLRSLTRYQNLPRVRDESVAEHSAMCSLILVMLEHLSGEDLTQAIRYSTVHDLAEIATTDVPHNVKRAFPSIAKAVDEAEEQLWKTEFLWAAKCKDRCNLRQKQWAKLADALSVLQYSDSEIALGNSYMASVRDETEQFIEAQLKALSLPKGFLNSFAM